MDKFNEKEYLEAVAKELNDNCESRKKPQKNSVYYGFRCSPWCIGDLNLDISECKSFCYKASYENDDLCDSCKKILEEKITKPFNKTKIELCLELIEIKKQLKYILEKINLDPNLNPNPDPDLL